MTLDCPKINLQYGSSGGNVKELQEGLQKLGYYTGYKVDSSFGKYTKSAVIAFQKRYGLKQDGIFGPVTCAKMTTITTNTTSANGSDVFDCPNTSLNKGSKEKEKVKILQKYLNEWGYYNKTIDGDYGDYTALAVKDFQNEVGTTSDGWFGPKTCTYFVKKVKNELDERNPNPYVIGTKVAEIPLYARYLKGTLTCYPNVIVEEEEEVTVQNTTASTDTSTDTTTESTDDSSSTDSTTTSEPTTTTTKIKRYKIKQMGSPADSGNGGLDCSKVSLKNGSSGDDVKTLQSGLAKMGYYTTTIDGSFGPKTEAAVIALQNASGITGDGWFGPQTCPYFNKKLGIDTSKVEAKKNYVLEDIINPTPNSDSDGLTHDCTLRTVYTQEKLLKMQMMQQCKLELMQDIDVVYTLDGYIADLKIVQENNVFFIELQITGYSAFLEQDFANYSGNKKQSEHLKDICQEIGLMLDLKLNGLKDENIEINKVTTTNGSGGSGGTPVQMSNNDCSNNTLESDAWAGHRCNPPKCTSTAKISRGNSSRSYATDTASHNGSLRELCEFVEAKCEYQLYRDNKYGSSRCPEAMWKAGKTGKIRGNCADFARMMKCILDVNGYKAIICHIPGHFYNAVWENGGWTVLDLCAKTVYNKSTYGHANHGNVKPVGTWDNPSG